MVVQAPCCSPRASLAWDKWERRQKERIDKQPYGDLRSGQKVERVLESPYAEAEGSPASRKGHSPRKDKRRWK